MDREKVITIIIGILVGVAVAFGVFYYFENLSKVKTPVKSAPGKQTNSVPPEKSNTSLVWNNPTDLSITKDKTVTIDGTATTGTNILLVTNADEETIIVDSSKKFTTTLKLEEGENKIELIYWATGQQPKGLSRTVIQEI